jgi:hypothetical protein
MKKKNVGPSQKLRHDDIGDTFPDSWVEALIVFIALAGIGGGALSLYYLSTMS